MSLHLLLSVAYDILNFDGLKKTQNVKTTVKICSVIAGKYRILLNALSNAKDRDSTASYLQYTLMRAKKVIAIKI